MSGFDAPGASAAKRGWGFAVQRGEAASIASICARRSGCTFAPWCGSGAKASAVTANANMLIGSMLGSTVMTKQFGRAREKLGPTV